MSFAIIAIRSLMDSQYNAIFNDNVSAMKLKTFLRRVTHPRVPLILHSHENFASIALYSLTRNTLDESVVKSYSRENKLACTVLSLRTTDEGFRNFSGSYADVMYFSRVIRRCRRRVPMLAAGIIYIR
jgi:hypothetical protein